MSDPSKAIATGFIIVALASSHVAAQWIRHPAANASEIDVAEHARLHQPLR